jgi:formylmethanofuran dehydrogenase subunit E
MISLKEAVKFHGHLGPYLILGILAGEYGLKKIKAKKYFGLEVKVWGADKKPKSCLIDGLQLSTGATYGKGNIHKFSASMIRIGFYNRYDNKKIILKLKKGLIDKLAQVKTHKDARILAMQLRKVEHPQLFDLTPINWS